jgi:Uma2 family endonuclease
MRAAHEVKTFRESFGLAEPGRRQELFDLEHFLAPRPSARHRLTTARLAQRIGRFLREVPLGTVRAAPVDLELSELEVVEPDLVLVGPGRPCRVTAACVAGVPDLVVEVVSEYSRRRDEVVRRALYARYGVGEYWVVDPELETVRTLRLEGGVYGPGRLLSREAGDLLTTALLPGFELPLAELFG